MLVIVWEYRARADRLAEFESLYGPDGAWAELFRGAPGFVSTTLMKDLRDARRFMIADRWTSQEVYEEFRRVHPAEYDALSGRGQQLYETEREIGRFDFVD